MSSFTFVLALTFAIACISLVTTRAAPTSAPSNSCQNECKEGEYCDEKLSSPSCTPCLDCLDYNREPGLGNCAKYQTECGKCFEGSEETEHECGSNSSDETAWGPIPPGTNVTDKTGVRTKEGDDSKDSIGGFGTYLATAGVLAAIVVTVVCALGRRPCALAQGWQWAKRRRSAERPAAHFRNVPQRDEPGQAVADGDVEFYDPEEGRLRRNEEEPPDEQHDERRDELLALLGNELNPAPAEAQQPPADPHHVLNEDSVHLNPDGARALPANNIPEGEIANGVDAGNNINEPAAPAEEQGDDHSSRSFPDSGAQSDDEPQLGGDNNENPAGNGNESGNDSGVPDDDRNDGTEHHVPQSPSSTVTQVPQSPGETPIAHTSNSRPYTSNFDTVVNLCQPDIANGAGKERGSGKDRKIRLDRDHK